jgi:hypothetical protein
MDYPNLIEFPMLVGFFFNLQHTKNLPNCKFTQIAECTIIVSKKIRDRLSRTSENPVTIGSGQIFVQKLF